MRTVGPAWRDAGAHPRFWEETADRLPIPEAETRDPFPFIARMGRALATHRGPRFNNNNWWLQGLAISFEIYDCTSNIKLLVAQGPAVVKEGLELTIGPSGVERRHKFRSAISAKWWTSTLACTTRSYRALLTSSLISMPA